MPTPGVPVRCDSPARECFAWHILPRLKGARPNDSKTSARALCPAHADREPSLSVSLEDGRVKWQCFACGREATARVRLALIREYGIQAGCLPLPAKEKQDILDLIEQILTADTADHAGVRLRAIAALEGLASLPRGGELERIACRAHVNRVTAYRARKNPPPEVKGANPGSYSPAEKVVKPRRSRHPPEVA